MVTQLLSAVPVWVIFVALLIAAIAVFVYLLIPKGSSVLWYTSERCYLDPNKGNKIEQFAETQEQAEVEVSLIVPAYDEAKRLPTMLDATITYLQNTKKATPSFSYEIVVVDDGSKDNTSEIALQYVKKYGTSVVRVLTLQKNRGKGGAVKRGMMVGRGKYMLMVDADGATDIYDFARVLIKLKKIETNGQGIVVGSRAHLADAVVAKRTLLRNILMYGFHIFVKIVGVPDIKDTQCGFKMFTRKSAHALFPNIHIERWAFDVELLYLAQRHKIPIVEEPVNWREIAGSKLSPFASSVQMATDLARIRLAYTFGVWKIKQQQKPTKRD